MKTVKVPKDYYYGVSVPETTVQLDDDGAVFLDGQVIGYVKKGTRTYAPPTHKGSRIVKYRKQVPEWHGFPDERTYGRPTWTADTRQEVLGRMLASRLEAA